MLMRQTLDYVFSNAERNNPKSILQTIDNFVLESGQFLMNVGPEKGEILKSHLLKSEPNNVIELGTFIGYSAVLISSTIGEKSQLTSIDSDIHSIEIAKELTDHIAHTLSRIQKQVIRSTGSSGQMYKLLGNWIKAIEIMESHRKSVKRLG